MSVIHFSYAKLYGKGSQIRDKSCKNKKVVVILQETQVWHKQDSEMCLGQILIVPI